MYGRDTKGVSSIFKVIRSVAVFSLDSVVYYKGIKRKVKKRPTYEPPKDRKDLHASYKLGCVRDWNT